MKKFSVLAFSVLFVMVLVVPAIAQDSSTTSVLPDYKNRPAKIQVSAKDPSSGVSIDTTMYVDGKDDKTLNNMVMEMQFYDNTKQETMVMVQWMQVLKRDANDKPSRVRMRMYMFDPAVNTYNMVLEQEMDVQTNMTDMMIK